MPSDAPPATAPETTPSPARSSFAAAWGLWIAIGGAVLLTTAALALATGQTALLDALDVGRWFR